MSKSLRHQEVVRLKDLLADVNHYLLWELRNLSGEEIIGENSGRRNVTAMVHQGIFREDPYCRLNIFPITIPPLRQRREDIPDQLAFFAGKKSRDLNLGGTPPIAGEAIACLQACSWPGNVRECENLVERELIQKQGR